MSNMQKTGGIAALIEAGTYLIGMVMMFTVLAPTLEFKPDEYVAFIADNQMLMHIWILIIYLVNSVFLVVLVQALHERLKDGSPTLARTATAFGLIWAGLVMASGMLTIIDYGVVADLYNTNPEQATSTWLILSTVEKALGGGIELPGGLWMVLVSWAGLQSKALPRFLNYFGLVVGLAGVLMVLPGASELASIFGLGAIVWFIWIGIIMLRGKSNNAK